jgi:pimeloyl-ACP methyl ester carboxylesterase
MAALRQRRVAVDGVELQVQEAGEPGAPLVLLAHGFPELSYSWRHQLGPLADAGYHVVAPDQRGYGTSSAPRDVAAYGIRQLTGDLVALVDEAGAEQAVVVGHDWGALVAWEVARLHPERVRAVVGASVPFVEWPAPPTALFRQLFGDRFFYMLYFQEVGPAEAEFEADPHRTMRRFLYAASGDAHRPPPTELPPMAGTRMLELMPEPPDPLPSWLTEDDVRVYGDAFAASGFFGPVSWYRNLDANYEVLKDLPASLVAMPSYFIAGALDGVLLMDPTGVDRMRAVLPAYRGETLIPGAGHWVQQERPEEFNAALLDFLASL